MEISTIIIITFFFIFASCVIYYIKYIFFIDFEQREIIKSHKFTKSSTNNSHVINTDLSTILQQKNASNNVNLINEQTKISSFVKLFVDLTNTTKYIITYIQPYIYIDKETNNLLLKNDASTNIKDQLYERKYELPWDDDNNNNIEKYKNNIELLLNEDVNVDIY